MLHYIRKKLFKMRTRRKLHAFGHVIRHFHLAEYGSVAFAQWEHPGIRQVTLTDPMVQFYRQYIPAGSMAIDIGAHAGDTTVPMALCAGPEGLVLGLEPNPYVFKVLQTNSSLNTHLTQIVPLNFAATATEGAFTFHYSDASFGNGGFFDSLTHTGHGHRHVLQVMGKNLEAYLHTHYAQRLHRLSFVKIDAEGYDKEIIKSMANLLQQYKPVVVCECNVHLIAAERTDLFDTLRGMGYRLYFIPGLDAPGGAQPLDTAAAMMRHKHFDMLALPACS